MRTLPGCLALLLALLPAAGCSTEITLSGDRYPAYVEVRPVDSAGGCVMGLETEFLLPDGSVQRGTNANLCHFTTAGTPGLWTLTFRAPQGYALAAGQENPVHVEVRKEHTARIGVRLVRR